MVPTLNCLSFTKFNAYDRWEKGGVVMGGSGYNGGGYGSGSGFALIVVLFILLIIVGAAFLY